MNKKTYFSTNLVSALTGLDVDDFSHFDVLMVLS
jgi:hypothetical protein